MPVQLSGIIDQSQQGQNHDQGQGQNQDTPLGPNKPKGFAVTAETLREGYEAEGRSLLDDILPDIDGAADLSDDEPEESPTIMTECSWCGNIHVGGPENCPVEFETDSSDDLVFPDMTPMEGETQGEAVSQEEAETLPEEEFEPVTEKADGWEASPASVVPTDADAELLTEIAEAERLCQVAEAEVNDAKEILKTAKKSYDGHVIHLRELARALVNDRDRPLFKQTKKPAAVPQAESTSTGATTEGSITERQHTPAGDEGEDYYAEFNAADISVLGLPAGVVTKLREIAYVNTIEELEKLRGEISNGNEDWPKGVGKAKQEAIEKAIEAYLEEYHDSKTTAMLTNTSADTSSDDNDSSNSDATPETTETEVDPNAQTEEVQQ